MILYYLYEKEDSFTYRYFDCCLFSHRDNIFPFRIIGSVKGLEMQWIVISGITYEAAHDTGFSYGDRGRFMGWVTNEKQRCRVYSDKSDIQGAISLCVLGRGRAELRARAQ